MAEKTKQHFVPKLLLKRFSWDDIHVNQCIIRKGLEIKSVPYKEQCQKRYFYGSDLHIENGLGKIEDLIEIELSKIINGCLIPISKPSAECLNDDNMRLNILLFIYIQYTRTLKARNIVDAEVSRRFELFKDKDRENMSNALIEASDDGGWGMTKEHVNEFINSLRVSSTDPFYHIFRVANERYNKNKHLKSAVIFNYSKLPFVMSDNPVLNVVTVFPEHVSSFFMPISPAHYLFYFNERYFNVDSDNNVIFTSDCDEIRYLNTLQCENSNINIYTSRLGERCTMLDLAGDNSSGGAFWKKINGISLSDAYQNNLSIPINGGHATKVDAFKN